VVELLDDHTLVTLTGAGGSGKTRLALQTAAELVDEHPDGVWLEASRSKQASRFTRSASTSFSRLSTRASCGKRRRGRFFMLETLREFAAERLAESTKADTLYRAHADWVKELALVARAELRGGRQVEFLDQLSAEHPNIRAALSYAISSDDAPLALAIAGSLGRFWVSAGMTVRAGSGLTPLSLCRTP
jgi:predicted ATPase